MDEDKARTLARLAGITHAMGDLSDGLVADLGHISEASEVGTVIEVTALPLWLPARRIIVEDPDVVPRFAGAGDDYDLVFAPSPDASPAIACLSPELAAADHQIAR
jgi:thiamine-monophosphate kinase